MSCCLLVFDKSKAPKTSAEFGQWFQEKSKWDEDRDYYDIKGTSKPLVDFFLEMNSFFPEMNGPYAPDEAIFNENPDLEIRAADYTIGSDLIYIGFPWSLAHEAVEKCRELAFKYDLGYCDMFDIYWDADTYEKMPVKNEKKTKEKQPLKKILLYILLFATVTNLGAILFVYRDTKSFPTLPCLITLAIFYAVIFALVHNKYL